MADLARALEKRLSNSQQAKAVLQVVREEAGAGKAVLREDSDAREFVFDLYSLSPAGIRRLQELARNDSRRPVAL